MVLKNKLSLRPKKISLKLNFKIFKSLLKILPYINVKILGYSAKIMIKKKYILLYLKLLKVFSNFNFNYLSDIAVIDYPWKINRFYVTYIIRSLNLNNIIYISTKTPLSKNIYSISNLYNSGSWVERECWDLFGVFFFLHKNLKRILTDYGFKGNPLKKDFPLIGYIEIFYNISFNTLKKRKIKNKNNDSNN